MDERRATIGAPKDERRSTMGAHKDERRSTTVASKDEKRATISERKDSAANNHKVTKTIITSPDIYKPVGPYSSAVLADKTLYVSGVLGMDRDSQLVCGGAEAQARQALDNLKFLLEAGGASLESVVKCTILLEDMNDYQSINEVYAEYFQKDCPARIAYQVAKLPLGAAVEIDAIALSGDLVVAEAGPCPCARN